MSFRVRKQRYVEKFPIGKLTEHPDNPNQGDVEAIEESIDELGFYGAVLAQESTGYILGGNHRYKAAIAEGATTIPALVIDCDDETALKILLGDNRIADLRTYDDRKLADLLSDMRAKSKTALRGTGYSDGDLQDLLARMGNTTLQRGGFDESGRPLEGGPEIGGPNGQVFGEGDGAGGTAAGDEGGEDDAPAYSDDPGKTYQNQYAVAVFCTDEDHQRATFERLAGLGYKCKVLVV